MAENNAPCFNRFQGGSIAFNVVNGERYINAVSYRSDKVHVGDCKGLYYPSPYGPPLSTRYLEPTDLCRLPDSELSKIDCLSTPKLSSSGNGNSFIPDFGNSYIGDHGVFSDDVFGNFDDNTERVFSISRVGVVAIGYPNYQYIAPTKPPTNSPTPSPTEGRGDPVGNAPVGPPVGNAPPVGPGVRQLDSVSDYVGHVSIFYPKTWGEKDPYFFANPELMAVNGFGSSVSLSDDSSVLAIGAPLARKVYVYKMESKDDWREFETLSIDPDDDNGSNFGKKVGLSSDGQFIVVASDEFAKVYYLPDSSSGYIDLVEPLFYSAFGSGVDFDKGVAIDENLLIVYGKSNSEDITTAKVSSSC